MRRAAAILAGVILLTACGAVARPTASEMTSPTPSLPVGTPTPGTARPTPWPRVTNLVYNSTGRLVLLFGGLGGGGTTDDTWTWDGATWKLLHPASNPPVREGAGLADDPGHGVVVLFGGRNAGNLRDDTWLWDGSNWKQVLPVHNPSPRTGAALTYDSVRHVVLLFGGEGGGNDTWTWDGIDWTQQSPVNSPPPRAYGRLAFDVARGVGLLFGGDDLGLDDTWEWNGTDWTRMHPANTPPGWSTATRTPQPMVYDAIRHVVMFVGPQQHTSLSADDTMETWTWDGITWTRHAPATTPPPRDGAGLAFDAARGMIVMAGGWSVVQSGDMTSTWGWDGANWRQLAG
jgi:hypothetical protein